MNNRVSNLPLVIAVFNIKHSNIILRCLVKHGDDDGQNSKRFSEYNIVIHPICILCFPDYSLLFLRTLPFLLQSFCFSKDSKNLHNNTSKCTASATAAEGYNYYYHYYCYRYCCYYSVMPRIRRDNAQSITPMA